MQMDEELLKFLNKIENDDSFALSRWGDGEYRLLKGDYLIRSDGELLRKRTWTFTPSQENQKQAAKKITDCLSYEADGLYWGITCPECSVCNVSGWTHYNMYENKDNLTFASMFVNTNHELFKERVPELLKNKTVYFVGHREGNINNLPFEVERHFKVGTNAWLNDLDILNEIMEVHLANENAIFLFACGPLSNYLITNLWRKNQNNVLLDIGSSYDLELYGNWTRSFHIKQGGYGKTCEWMKNKNL
mgnify:FL=1